MKNKSFTNIFYIAVLTFIFTFGMVVSVMADDTEVDATSADAEVVEDVIEETADEEPVIEQTEELQDSDEEASDDIDMEDETVDDTDDIDTDEEINGENEDIEDAEKEDVEDPNGDDEFDVTDDEGAGSANEDESAFEEKSGDIEPEDNDEDEGELGDSSYYDPESGITVVNHPDGSTSSFVDATVAAGTEIDPVLGEASWAEPVEGGMMYYVQYPDGRIESWFESDEIESWLEPDGEDDLGVVGDASFYNPNNGITTVYSPNGDVTYYYEETSYRTAAAYISDTFVPLAAEAETPAVVEEPAKEKVVEEEIFAPVVEEETAVLGDYEEPASRNLPLTAGIALLSSTIVGLGVLWKLGIIAL